MDIIRETAANDRVLASDHDTITDQGIIRFPIHRFRNGEGVTGEDELAVEEPLEIQLGYVRNGTRLHKSVSITMRTPGHDAELAAGFLLGEGVIAGLGDIEEIQSLSANVVRVDLKPHVQVDLCGLQRHFYATSSCGVCGKASIAALRMDSQPAARAGGPVFSAEMIHRLPEKLRETQDVFERTGGLHAAGLFDTTGTLICRREDVGRHNAVDKTIGARLLAGETPPFGDSLLFVSGRASFELMQKTLAAGIPILAAVSAPSSLAVRLARDSGATLLGFVRDGRFNIYTHPERIMP